MVYYWHFFCVFTCYSHWGIILLFHFDLRCVLWALVMTETPASASSVCHLWMTSSPFSIPVSLYPQSVIACSHDSGGFSAWFLFKHILCGLRKPIRYCCGWILENFNLYFKKIYIYLTKKRKCLFLYSFLGFLQTSCCVRSQWQW